MGRVTTFTWMGSIRLPPGYTNREDIYDLHYKIIHNISLFTTAYNISVDLVDAPQEEVRLDMAEDEVRLDMDLARGMDFGAFVDGVL